MSFLTLAVPVPLWLAALVVILLILIIRRAVAADREYWIEVLEGRRAAWDAERRRLLERLRRAEADTPGREKAQ